MAFQKIEFEFSDDDNEKLEIEGSGAVEIDISGKVRAINVSRSSAVNNVVLQENNTSKSHKNLHLVGLFIIIVILVFVGL